MNKKIVLPLAGAITAILSLLLVKLGNPANMGVCVACFVRDIAGSLKLHNAIVVQYFRPEIVGIIFGSLLLSVLRREFAAKGGSAPVTRFILGFSLMVGALLFLGCPLRMVLRLAGGDLNAILGLLGFTTGILIGAFFLKKGYTLQQTNLTNKTDSLVLPIITLVLFTLVIFVPSLIVYSTSGPGSMKAPVLIALSAGLIMGIVGFFSRLCFVASIRDSILFKNFTMLSGFVTIILVGLIGNIILGNFKLGFEGQPIAHTEWLWNSLGMMMVGFCSVLLGGCPFRQLILAGSGNSDSAITILGMVAGAAFAHNFNLASSVNGVTTNGKIGFFILLAIVSYIAIFNTFKKRSAPVA